MDSRLHNYCLEENQILSSIVLMKKDQHHPLWAPEDALDSEDHLVDW